MKTYKVIFMAFATMILGAFVLTGCSGEEISESQINNNSLKRVGVLDLSKDTDFIELYNLFSDYAEKEKDAEQINYFISKIERDGDLNNEEMELFIQSMGYISKIQASDYARRFVNLSVSLDNKYGISDMEQGELGDIFVAGFESYETYSNNCDRRARNCYARAAGLATAAHIGCAVLDLTVVLGLACHAAVTLVWMADNDDCKLNYEECGNQAN